MQIKEQQMAKTLDDQLVCISGKLGTVRNRGAKQQDTGSSNKGHRRAVPCNLHIQLRTVPHQTSVTPFHKIGLSIQQLLFFHDIRRDLTISRLDRHR